MKATSSAPTRAATGTPVNPLSDINLQCLQCFIEAAKHSTSQVRGLAEEVGSDLAKLPDTARQRLAQLPFLLIDMRFADHDWWEAIAHSPARTTSGASWLTPLPRQSAVRLARTTLTLAWHSSRVAAMSARIQLGLTPAVGAVLSSLALPDIDQLAELHYRNLRPRWEDRPAVWKHLLIAAGSIDSRALTDFGLRCLEVISGDVCFVRN